MTYAEFKKHHSDYLFIARNGDFAEIYSLDSFIASELLGIKRDEKGIVRFPWDKIEKYLPTFIRAGIKVGIQE